MYELKSISPEAIPAALERAERYRLLNQPRPAESICLDILRIDPQNQQALVVLLLSLTDQFGRPGCEVTIQNALEILPRLSGAYERAYYDGVISERWGKALLSGKAPARAALDWIRQAMVLFEKAESIAPAGNDEAILRWNACARLIMRIEKDSPAADEADPDAGFSEDAPLR